jgi:hypothetical protein
VNRYDAGHPLDDEPAMDTLAQLKAGLLAGATRLDLACGLSEFPDEIFSLADTLQVLNLTGNALTRLPDDLYRLKELRVLFCSDNAFTQLPEALGRCEKLSMVGFKANRIEDVPASALPPNLRWLILTDNSIATLPSELGNCHALQKLMLAGNRLTALPATLARCEQLELLRIAANCLPALPAWLLRMPRLAWLAYASNPMAPGYSAPHGGGIEAQLPWAQLQLQQQLGEGASGVIQQARLADGTSVAVKLYKGDITSDGSPLNEMNACIAAGNHPGLIKVIGCIGGHPENVAGLVMELIEPTFGNLAGPPSLASCTRDVYPQGLRMAEQTVLRVARAIAATAGHLHARGINHGDLYAHNILWREDGECLLGDFGAASFYPTGDVDRAQALQRIEVCAFGVLLGELLEHCERAPERLWQLQRDCIQPEVLQRPAFSEVLGRLA